MVTISVIGASRGDLIELFRADGGPGAGPCPAVLGGNCLDMLRGTTGSIQTLTQNADSAGTATWTFSFPNIAWDTLCFQAFVLSNSKIVRGISGWTDQIQRMPGLSG
jgi:hypothetical protein